MVTALNIESYVKEYAGGGGGGDEPTVPPDLPDKSNLFLGNTFTWGMLPWVVVHVDDSAQECYLAVSNEFEISSSGHLDFSVLNAQNNLIATTYLTEGQRAALKYIVAGTTSGRLFSPTEEQVVSTFDYYRTSKSNRIWGRVTWWTSTATKYVNAIGDIVQYTGEKANTTRPHCCIDMSLYDSQEGGGSELNPELPDKDSLTVGNTVTFAGQQWIVVHKTITEAYLTLKDLSGSCTWFELDRTCQNWEDTHLNADQKAILKTITADTISGYVFVASKDQMEEGFEYFYTANRRIASSTYWTSTDIGTGNMNYAWWVNMGGYLSSEQHKSSVLGFRPSICIDLTLYNT